MPLQQLVEYFNDRFEIEHQSHFRPLMLEDGIASALFGAIRINSQFTALRQTKQPELISGYAAQIAVTTYDPTTLPQQQLEHLLEPSKSQGLAFESIVNFDRLARTVHMLNFLPTSHLQHTLFMEVDPRHILGIKADHGAYFEEIIAKCGLENRNIVIVTSLNVYGTKYYQGLKQGLENYRARGYQIGLRLNYLANGNPLVDYIAEAQPNYVILSARNLEEQLPKAQVLDTLQAVQARAEAIGGKVVLQHVHEKHFDQLARESGVELVAGNYYRSIAYNYRNHLHLNGYNLAVLHH